MIDYKKIITSRKMRFAILNLLSFIPDEPMIRLQYYLKTGRKLHLNNPKRYTEKLQWYKLFYRNPLMKKCVDKYDVRDYVKSKGLDNILVDNYGVYQNIDEINWKSLPNRFVIKSTTGGGGNNIIIVKDKANLDIKDITIKLKSWLVPCKKSSGGREWAYEGLEPKLIVDQFLENKDNPDSGIYDYKFFCFNGKVEYVVLDIDRYVNHKRNFYDSSWHYLDVVTDHDTYGDTVEKPYLLDKMKEVAEILSQDFPFVRVDLYCVDNRVFFGELTFYPWSGYLNLNPDEFDFIMGEDFVLQKKTIETDTQKNNTKF